MRKLISLLLALTLFAAPLVAQTGSTPKGRRVADKKFWLVTAAAYASAVADEEVTQYEVSKNPSLHEANPLFGDSRKTAYPVMIGLTTFSTVGAYFMKKGGSKYWYLAPTISGGVHGFAIGYNISLGRQR